MKSWMSLGGLGLAMVTVTVVAAGAGGCSSSSTSSSTSTSSTSDTSSASASGTGGSGSTGTGGSGGAQASVSSSASGTGGASASSSSSASGTGGSIGAPFTSIGAASYEAQTSITSDPKGGVVAAWIGFFADNTSAIGYAVSRDAGATFTPPAYIKSPGGRAASSPVLAVDGQGRISLAWLGFTFDFNNPDEHIYLSRLDNATETFGAPVIASDDGVSTTRDFDKPSITVDAKDDLLITWADFTGTGMGAPAQLTLARSSDGATFTRSTITSDASFGNLAYLCVDTAAGPTAPLYLVHLGAGGTVTLRHSTDQGVTWQTLPAVPATNVIFQDITCAVHGSDLWITYASGTAPFMSGKNTPADAVSVLHSANGGTSFDAVVTASSGAAGTQYLFPMLARSPAGSLEIVYYQGTEGNPAALMRATSMTGATWTTSKLADAGTFTLDRFLASWLGDYLGVTATVKGLFTSYTENTQNKAHIGFAHPTP
jgi:hypothetical protein